MFRNRESGSPPRYRLSRVVVAFFALGLASFAQVHAQDEEARKEAGFLLATGGPGGVYAPLGRSLCILYNRERVEESDPACRAVLSSGSSENIERLRSGEAAVAIVQSDTAHWAVRGEGPFAEAGPFEQLRVLFPVHDEEITFLLGKGVEARVPADLLGLRAGVHPPRTGPSATLAAILGALGWAREDFATFSELPVDSLIDALCAGEIDAAALVVGHPNGYVQRALHDCGARLMSFAGPEVERAVNAIAFLDDSEIPANTYRGQVDAVPTPGVTALVVTTKQFPNAYVERFVEGVKNNEEVLRQMHPAFRDVVLTRSFSMSAELEKHPGLSTH